MIHICSCCYVSDLVMVVKKKAPKVEAVALDDVKLKSLTGEWKKSPLSGCAYVTCNISRFLPDSLSVDGDSSSTELAGVLKDSLSSSDPVEQIQLISKVGLHHIHLKDLDWVILNALHLFVCWLQAGFLLEQLREDECTMGPLLQACLSTLAFLFTTLPAKNPLKRTVARSHISLALMLLENQWLTSVCFVCVYLSV